MEQGCKAFVDRHIKGKEGSPVAIYEPIRAFLIEMPLRLILGLGDTAPEIFNQVEPPMALLLLLRSQVLEDCHTFAAVPMNTLYSSSALPFRHVVVCADSISSVSLTTQTALSRSVPDPAAA
eukprot:6086-Heterococcus_DN1.PRE.1